MKSLICLRNSFVGLVVAMAMASASYSQTGQVSGIIIDQQTKLSLPGATVKATLIADSTQWTGAVSDLDGRFGLNINRTGDYQLTVNFLGYEAKEVFINVSSLSGTQSVDNIELKSALKQLSAVVVEEIQKRVVMKGDTAVYNADAFKVNRDADAASLLQKMPGVTEQNGTISVQGEQLQRILVDGKEFFGSDPRVALNALPAEIIDKIQVFDQLSEQSQASGFNDGNTIKTVNIITKSGKSEGEFGKIFAGAGTDERYLAGGNLNIFRGGRRISILGLSNNVNQANFASEDIAGATGTAASQVGQPRRGPRNSDVGTGSAEDFLVPPQNGINTTTALGLNYSDQWGKNFKLNASYLFNRTENANDYNLTRNFTSASNAGQTYSERAFRRSTSVNHKFNLRSEYTISPKSAIIFRPSIAFQQYDAFSDQAFQTALGDSLVTRGLNNTQSSTRTPNYNSEIIFRQRFEKEGQSFSLSVQSGYNVSDGTNKLLSQSAGDGEVLETIDNWQAERDRNQHSQRLNISYTHPIAKKVSMELAYRPAWEQTESSWNTLEVDDAGNYTILDSALSNVFETTFLTHEARMRLRFRGDDKSSGVAGLNYLYTDNDIVQQFPEANTSQHIYRNWAPFILYRKTYENKASIFALYRGSPDLPSASELNPVLDNSNPLQVTIGNTALFQAYSHRFVTRFNLTNAKKGSNFFAFIEGQAQQDRITTATRVVSSDTTFSNGFVLPAGGQISQPLNLDGYYNLRTFANYGFPVSFIKSNLNLNSALVYTQNPGQINGDLNSSRNTGWNVGFLFASNISEAVDFTYGASSDFNWVSNTLDNQQDFNYRVVNLKAGGTFVPFKRWVVNTDINYSIWDGLGDRDQNIALWNLAVGYRFLKDESLELRLTGVDLLKQNNSLSRNVTPTYVEDSETTVLQRYFLVSVSYRLRRFTKGDEGVPAPSDTPPAMPNWK